MIGKKLNTDQKKMIQAVSTVYEKLIDFKKSKDSELVVLQDGKIIKIKPWLDKK